MDINIVKVLNKKAKDYKSLPFWSWNGKLDKKELLSQIRWIKENGFGGYFMHARGGLLTEYLGKEWFDCVKTCVEEGKKKGLQSWVYDENGWPSGFLGGKLLEKEENRERYLTFSQGEYDKNSYISYDLDNETLTETLSGKNCLNIFMNVSVSTADILNPRVVDEFVSGTHEKYKHALGNEFCLLKGFFTDEPQYYRNAQPYTPVLEKVFKEKYGEDVRAGLGFLFCEKDGYREFRYKYWSLMNRLITDNYAKKIYNWCTENGVQLTGHFIDENCLLGQMIFCAGIMPLYRYEHIIGIDWLGRIISNPCTPRQASSIARQLGRKKVMSETFAMCGWDVTPLELKRIADWQYVNGVNLMCQHLIPYSEMGQRKRDYPAHYSVINPWVKKGIKFFNDYYSRLGALLGNAREIVKVGVFCPIKSLYSVYKYGTMNGGDIDASYLNLCEKLSSLNIPYHIIDEDILSEFASVTDNRLRIGEYEYEFVIFPKTTTLTEKTGEILEKYYLQGGKILFTDGIPEYREYLKYDYEFLSNVSFNELLNEREYEVDDPSGNVRSTMMEIDGKRFIFAVNISEKERVKVSFEGNFSSFMELDIETLRLESRSKTIYFEPYRSFVLFLSDKTSKPTDEKNTFVLKEGYRVIDCSPNYLLLDKVSYSKDGINYSDKMGYMGVFNSLIEEKYVGKVYLKYEFEVKTVPEKLFFLSEKMNNIECRVNGNKFQFDGASDLDKNIFKSDVTKHIKIGANEIVMLINFYQSNKVYYALFGENVTENIKNCLVYDTTVEPCYLAGDFGVFFERPVRNGKKENVYVAEGNCYIDKRNNFITDFIKDGYPFFIGNITLEKEFMYDGKSLLKLDGRFHLCEVYINGQKVKKSFFYNTIDISGYAHKGKNIVRITLYSGLRNLFGPHHLKDEEESFFVGPDSFELVGSWKDGISEKERNAYTLIRFGLFN